MDELFTLPIGLDPELEKAIEEFTATKKKQELKVKDLQERAAQGGVKGLAAKNELEQLEAQGNSNLCNSILNLSRLYWDEQNWNHLERRKEEGC